MQARNMTQDKVREACVPRDQDGVINDYTDRLGITAEVQASTEAYAAWSAAAELRTLSSLGIDVLKAGMVMLEPFTGRGLPPVFVAVPLMGKVERIEKLAG